MYTYSTIPNSQRPLPANRSCPANHLDPQQRQRLALEALAGTQPISHLADERDVSRKFVYQQTDKAQQALNHAFAPDPPEDQQVLLTLPITKALLRQIVLGLILICHSSFRGVVEFLRDILGFHLSLGSVANIVQSAVGRARAYNDGQDLSTIAIGAHDEIFQGQDPVLVGVCARSTYCYLLSQEEHRDAETWAVRLLELKDRGFQPDATVGDGGTALRAGQALALPGVQCRGDVFHPLYEFRTLLAYLERRAYQAIATCVDLEGQLARPGKRRDENKRSLVKRLTNARAEQARAVTLADDCALLLRWLREDILSVAGPDYATRVELYDLVVAELGSRSRLGPQGIEELCRALKNQREDLLAFVVPLESDLAALAAQAVVPVAVVRELLRVQTLSEKNPRRWQSEAALRQQLRGRYYELSVAVAEVAEGVVRASSVAENLNSRLRCYFFLRRELGPDYLSLLQFFLNHRRFQRSEHAERVGKSPAELLTGQAHGHWLELLGYQRFQWN